MNALELADNQLTHVIGENNNGEEVVITLRKPLYLESFVRQQQAEIEKLRSWVEMLVEVPFFNEIDHYRGIPVAILRKASEK